MVIKREIQTSYQRYYFNFGLEDSRSCANSWGHHIVVAIVEVPPIIYLGVSPLGNLKFLILRKSEQYVG